MEINKNKDYIECWFSKGNKTICLWNFKHIRKRNKQEYPNDPDINAERKWGIHTNGARKGNPEDSCLDLTIDLGHISINYVNFDYNKRYRD